MMRVLSWKDKMKQFAEKYGAEHWDAYWDSSLDELEIELLKLRCIPFELRHRLARDIILAYNVLVEIGVKYPNLAMAMGLVKEFYAEEFKDV